MKLLVYFRFVFFCSFAWGTHHEHDHTSGFVDVSHGCNSGYIAVRGTSTCMKNPCSACKYGIFSKWPCRFAKSHRHKRRVRLGGFNDHLDEKAQRTCKQVRKYIEANDLYNKPDEVIALRDLHNVKYLQNRKKSQEENFLFYCHFFFAILFFFISTFIPESQKSQGY